jgi:hypothetical protein
LPLAGSAVKSKECANDLLFLFVSFNNAILDIHDAVCVFGNVMFVGDQDDRVSLTVQTIE